TGGISEVNTNDFGAAIDKIMARSDGYYTLAYTPNEGFDNKFHKLDVKVKRSGVKVSHHSRYLAREDKSTGPRTKEEDIAAAARSPSVKSEVDVTPNIAFKWLPVKVAVDILLLFNCCMIHLPK